jgi:hypothetical protein
LREDVMVAELRWSFFALALMAAVLAAYMFWYEPLAVLGTSTELTLVWDRWAHRLCMTGMGFGNTLICTRDERAEFERKKQ